MMTILRSNSPSTVTLPEELIIEILSLLNVKSLTQLKCVSKSWNSIISDSFFVKLHLHKSSRNPHILLFPSQNFTNSISVSFHVFPILCLLENPSYSKYQFMELPFYHYAIGSCNGLTCFINSVENKFYLWNPLTTPLSQNLTSFSFPFERQELVFILRFSFGYDNLTNKYKLLAFHYKGEVRIFTFGDNVWKNIQWFSVYPYHSNANEGVYLNNSLNWFALLDYKPFYNKEDLKVEQLVIISLDLATEIYTQFQLPREFDEFPSLEPILCKLMDTLCLSHYIKKHSFDIWQMTEFGVEKSWTKFLKFDYHSLLGCSIFVVSLLPLHVFENGDVLIWERNVGQLIRYNRRDNRVVEKTTYTNNNIYLSFAVLYVESLVSTF